MTEYRVEHDSMGEVRVPVDALWGAQTQRAVENFPISGRPVDGRVIRALALIKSEAAKVNAGSREVPGVDRRVANAIAAVADEIAGGALPRRVPDRRVPNRLGHVHEHEHERGARVPRVRASRRSRFGAPERSGERVAVVERRVSLGGAPGRRPGDQRRSHPCGRRSSRRALRKKQREFAHVVKSGRTHLMDATPVTLGQEFGGYATQVDDGDRAAAATRCRGCACCRSAAPRSVPASTHRRVSPAR